MNGLVKHEQQNIVGFFHNGNGGLTVPKPFVNEIFLYRTHIAGTTHIADMEEIAASIEIGEKLDMFRETDNQYDKRAIVIKRNDGTKLGYVPKTDNIIFSRLMDAGKCVFAKVSEIETKGTWHEIKIEIFMQD